MENQKDKKWWVEGLIKKYPPAQKWLILFISDVELQSRIDERNKIYKMLVEAMTGKLTIKKSDLCDLVSYTSPTLSDSDEKR